MVRKYHKFQYFNNHLSCAIELRSTLNEMVYQKYKFSAPILVRNGSHDGAYCKPLLLRPCLLLSIVIVSMLPPCPTKRVLDEVIIRFFAEQRGERNRNQSSKVRERALMTFLALDDEMADHHSPRRWRLIVKYSSDTPKPIE